MLLGEITEHDRTEQIFLSRENKRLLSILKAATAEGYRLYCFKSDSFFQFIKKKAAEPVGSAATGKTFNVTIEDR